MDTLIEGYLQLTFHPEMNDTIHHAFQRMNDFGLSDYEFDFVNLLMSADEALPQATQDHFTTLLHQKLDFIIHAHLISLNETAALHQKVAVLDGLYAVQHLNDYSNIITVLEAEYDHDEKLAEILGQVCEITPVAFLSILDKFDHETLTTLKQYIYGREANEGKLLTSYSAAQKKIVENLKQFKKYRQGKNCLGLMLLDSNVLIGQPVDAYVPYITDYLTTDDYDALAVNIFSLVLLSDDGLNNPVLTFRKHAGTLLDDLHSVTKVDTLIVHYSLAFDKWKHEQQSGATA